VPKWVTKQSWVSRHVPALVYMGMGCKTKKTTLGNI